jgi:hypothetical protein
MQMPRMAKDVFMAWFMPSGSRPRQVRPSGRLSDL